jgi:hypothetical protein
LIKKRRKVNAAEQDSPGEGYAWAYLNLPTAGAVYANALD